MSNANVETIHQTTEPPLQPQKSSKRKISSNIPPISPPQPTPSSSSVVQPLEESSMSSETDEEGIQEIPEPSEPSSIKSKPSKLLEPSPTKSKPSKSSNKTQPTPKQSKSKNDNIDVLTLPNELDDTIPSLPSHPEQTTHNNKKDDNEVLKQLKTEKIKTQIPQISVKVKFARFLNLEEH